MSDVSTKQACELARKLEGVSEKNHFGSDAFCANGRIFATVWHDKNRVNLMLNEEQQRSFLLRDGGDAFITLENAWGSHAIGVDMESIDRKTFIEALQTAWFNSANKRSMRKTKTKPKKRRT